MNSEIAKFLELRCFKMQIMWQRKYIGRIAGTYNIDMAQDDTEPEILLQFSYPIIQVIWMEKMVPDTASTKTETEQ